jgi:hypothetical protein
MSVVKRKVMIEQHTPLAATSHTIEAFIRLIESLHRAGDRAQTTVD